MDQPVLRAPLVIRNSAIHRGSPYVLVKAGRGRAMRLGNVRLSARGLGPVLSSVPRDCPAICEATGCCLDGEGQEDCDSVAGIAAHKAAKSTPHIFVVRGGALIGAGIGEAVVAACTTHEAHGIGGSGKEVVFGVSTLYRMPDTCLARLTVTDDGGATGTAAVSITVGGSCPQSAPNRAVHNQRTVGGEA